MKRPLALIGLTSMLVLTVCFYASFAVVNWIFGLSVAGLIISLVIRKLRKKPELMVFFAVVLVAVTAFNMFSQFYVKPLQNTFSGKNAEVTATLLEEPEANGSSYYYTLKTKTIDGKNKSLKLMLQSSTEIYCDVGDTLNFTAELERVDYGKKLADKIYLRAYIDDEAVVSASEHKPVNYYIVKLRQSIRHILYTELQPETADLSAAVLLGDSNFCTATYESMRKAGLTHIVVVSGLHLSIITFVYAKSFGRYIKNKYVNALATILLVLFFLTLTGFGKSSIRAAVMLAVLIVSKLFKREGDSLNSLGFASILLCLNPYVVGDIGILLSFSATFGIVVFSVPLYEFLTKRLEPEYKSKHKQINKSVRFLAEQFAVTVSAVLCTLPINVIFFGRVSLVQFFANLLVAPMVKWFMVASVLCICSNYLCLPIFAYFFSFAVDFISKVMLYLAKLFASIPMAYVKADYGFVMLWIAAVIILFAFAYFIRRNGKGLHTICIIMSLLILTAGVLAHTISSHNKLTVYITPSKHGQSIVLSGKDGNILLCSTDYTYALSDTAMLLEDIYTEKQLAVIAEENPENLPAALFDYKEVLMYDNICKNNCIISLWDKGTLYVSENNGRVYIYLSYADTTVLILPDSGNVRDIPEDLRCPDVLVSSGIIDNMELLSFKTLISNGNDFRMSAVTDFFRNRDINAVQVSDTVNFDIVG